MKKYLFNGQIFDKLPISDSMPAVLTYKSLGKQAHQITEKTDKHSVTPSWHDSCLNIEMIRYCLLPLHGKY